jgi:hypothetical protein
MMFFNDVTAGDAARQWRWHCRPNQGSREGRQGRKGKLKRKKPSYSKRPILSTTALTLTLSPREQRASRRFDFLRAFCFPQKMVFRCPALSDHAKRFSFICR